MSGSILYHANCLDGFGAAWCVQRKFPHYTLHPMNYGDSLPDPLGEDVWIVDFSIPGDELLGLVERTQHITLLDHHETAFRHLKDWSHPKAKVLIDMSQSGAGLTWREIYPEKQTPKFIRYIEDRDLWQFKLPFSRAISYWMFAEIQTVQDLDTIFDAFEDPHAFQTILGQAQVLEDFVKIQVNIISKTAKEVTLSGIQGLAVQTPVLQSEVGELLAQKSGLGILYTERSKGYSISLRSCGSLNVAHLAESFGGGGHPRAAGFYCETLPF